VPMSPGSPTKPLHDPIAPPERDPPDKPMHDPPGDPTFEPPQPVTEPTPNPASDPPPEMPGDPQSDAPLFDGESLAKVPLEAQIGQKRKHESPCVNDRISIHPQGDNRCLI
jgi:hypothetical protein